MKASTRRASMINMDTSLSTFSESFYRLFNNLNEDAEESLVSLLEEKVIPKSEKEDKIFKESYKRPKTLMVDRQYETRRSFHRKRKDNSEDQFLKTYEYYESLHSPAVARRRSSSIAVPQPTIEVSNFLHADKPPRSVSPRPTAGARKCAITTATPQRNRTASMPTVSRQKNSNPFQQIAIVSAVSKLLKLFVLFVQFTRLSKFRHIIQTFFVIDCCLHSSALLDDGSEPGIIKNKESRVGSVVASACSVLLVLIIFFYMEYSTSESITNKILILINDLTIMVVFTIDVQFYGLCEMLEKRFRLLNDTLKRSISVGADWSASQQHIFNTRNKLRAAFSIYWKVVDLLELVVRTYRLQIFAGLCLTFLHLLIDVYLTMYSITGAKHETWMEALNARPLCHFSRLVMLSSAGHRIRKQPMLSQTRRQDDPDGYYRLRSFSITPNGVCKNLGDCLKTKRSRSSCSVDSSPAPVTQRLTGANSQESNNELPVFTVGMLGATNVGKTTLSYQFTTSEYICAYDTSLDDEFGQKTVCISLNGQEAEFNIIDIPASEMSVETFCYTFNVDVFVVVYSIIDAQSFKTAEEILLYLWKNDYMSSKGVILVGNKADLERRREIPASTGRKLALNLRCKFIETSSGLDHNVDELLVGIFAQVQLNPKRNRMQQRGAVENGKQLFKQILKLGKKAKSCENLFVL